MKFYGKTKEGKTTVDSALRGYLEALDGDFEIKVTLTKDLRSLKMNNLYWLWLTILSDESGYLKSELHAYFKNKLLCFFDSVNGEQILNCPSTSDLTIKEFQTYLINIGRLAAENFNCVLPDQNLVQSGAL